MYHITLPEVSERILLPGDPARVRLFKEIWDSYEEIYNQREFRIAEGKYKGKNVTVCSTGIGSPSAGIALEELTALGGKIFIRVGSTGAIQDWIKCGDLIINTGAVRLEGTSKEYIRTEYPAVADFEVVSALIDSCKKAGVRYHVGIGASTDSFYVGQEREKGIWQPLSNRIFEELRHARVLNFEMECAAIFTLASLFGVKAGGICAVFAERARNIVKKGAGELIACKIASEAITRL